RLLDAVLAEDALPGGNRRLDRLGGGGLAGGDQRGALAGASGPRGGGRDARADIGEIAGDMLEHHARIVPARSSGNRRRTLKPMEILVYSGLELLGDGVMKLPFVRALRRCFPTARITWLAGKGK